MHPFYSRWQREGWVMLGGSCLFAHDKNSLAIGHSHTIAPRSHVMCPQPAWKRHCQCCVPSDLVPLDMTVFAPSKLGDKNLRLIFLANTSQRDRQSMSVWTWFQSASEAIYTYLYHLCNSRLGSSSKTKAWINLPRIMMWKLELGCQIGCLTDVPALGNSRRCSNI